jgi:LAS superfamily LD-carboxypeptidase LdcB
MSFQAVGQLTPPIDSATSELPKVTDCFFCGEDGKALRIGSDNPPRIITDLTVVGKPKSEGLPSSFEPSELIDIDARYMTPLYRDSFTPEYIASGLMEKMRKDAYHYLVSMLNNAHASNIDLYIHSAYRPYDIQCKVFSGKLVKQLVTNGHLPATMTTLLQFKKETMNGYIPPYNNTQLYQAITEVNTRSALPGQSEHQLGSVADLVTYLPEYEKPEKKYSGYALENAMENTVAFKWLQENAYKYGYALSYPTPVPLFGKDISVAHPRTGYIYEPWHWRFIGPARALDYKYCGGKFVLREYLHKIALNPKFSCVQKPVQAPAAKKPVMTTQKKTTPPPAKKTTTAPTKKTTKSWLERTAEKFSR